jgi:shikimate dehydrogenase
MISGSTQVIGIIGDPVAHSLSPAMHNAAFAALGLDMVYVPLPVRRGAVAAAVAGLAALGLRGANVTVPHKAAVLPHLTWLADDARLAQAVNTIVVDGKELRGYNTDVEGVHIALAGHERVLAGEAALILGAGGAARAAALALARLGMSISVASRSPEACELVAAMALAAGSQAAHPIPWEQLTPAAVAAPRLVVNATPLGMAGAEPMPAQITDGLHEGQIVLDAVYGSSGTEFLRRAGGQGAATVDGREMLLGQAAAAFTLWTGREAPRAVMRAALEGTPPESPTH